MSFILTSREEKHGNRRWNIGYDNWRSGYEANSVETGLPESLPLVAAAAKGNLENVKELIEAGADVNAEDYSGTPLTAAVENGYHKLVELLLNTGADVDQRDFFGETPIFYAAYSKCADLLIKAGADVNVRGMNDTTPLLQAAYNGSVNCAKSLIKARAPLNVENSYEFNALSSSLAYSSKGVNSTLVILLYAAGVRLEHDHFADRLREVLPDEEIRLKDICRKSVTTDLMMKKPNVNLFIQIPRLQLPTTLKRYLLYDMSLEEDSASNWVTMTDM